MRVPLLDVKAQNAPLRGALLEAVTRVMDSGGFILGPEVEAFEKELAAALGVARAIGVSSGTDALLVALMALGVGQGDEVVTTPLSFFATVGCIARLGARPVFADIEPESFNLDPAAAAAACGAKTRAVIPVHLFGRPASLAQGQPARGRGCGAVHRCLQVRRHHELLVLLSLEEPGRIRRRRRGPVRRCPDGGQGRLAACARQPAQVRAPGGGRELPPGCFAGRHPAGQAASACGLDRGAAGECRAIPPLVRGHARDSTRVAPAARTCLAISTISS